MLEAHNLIKQFGKVYAVDDVSFEISDGTIFALLGSNGAGKTTIIKMLAGLVRPTSGRVLINGHDVISERKQAIAHIGAVLEGARNTYWRLTPIQNMAYFGRLHRVSRKLIKSRIDELINDLQMGEIAKKEVRTLSRGQKQIVAIATALVHRPTLLLLDEPTLGLDVQTAMLMEKYIVALRDEGVSILLTTHTLDIAERIATDVLMLHEGKALVTTSMARLLSTYATQRMVFELDISDIASFNEGIRVQLRSQYPSLEVSDGKIRLQTDEQAHWIALLQTLHQSGIQIEQVVHRRATLQEIFVTLINEANQA